MTDKLDKEILDTLLTAVGTREAATDRVAHPLPFDAYAIDGMQWCPKCDASHSGLHIVHYSADHDLLYKNCSVCGFGWQEYCKDHNHD